MTLMTNCIKHESFYNSGTFSVAEMGISLGWVAHGESFAAGQMFFSQEGDVALAFSGECFAGGQEVANLGGERDRFRNGRENWLVHLYEHEGENFFEKLNGLFSGFLIDKKRRTAFLFNDRYGAERVYWHEAGGAMYFASEAKALLRILPELRAFDPEGIAQFLTFGCTLNSKTLFRGVHLLPGGSLWSFDGESCKKKRYFDSKSWECLPTLDEDSYESQFEETFKRILPRYFETGPTLAISLTGGLDTRMIMACLPELRKPPACYTFSGEKGETLDDRVAAKVASACGLNHELLRIGADFFSSFASHVDRTVYVTDGYFGLTGAHEIYFNAQARRLGLVRMTGLFGSEILRNVSTFKPGGPSLLLVAPEFRPLLTAVVDERPRNHSNPVTFSAFQNVPWNLFGSMSASRSQVILRTPYLDNDLVALAYQAPANLRTSAGPSLRLVANNNDRLSKIATDRGIGGQNSSWIKGSKRFFLETSFKIDYLYNEGMPHRFCRFDSFLASVNSHIRIFGQHKFLHYRRWFRRQLAPYVIEVFGDPGVQQNSLWNPDFVREIAQAHIQGRGNYAGAINAVLTIEAIERLLFRELARDG